MTSEHLPDQVVFLANIDWGASWQRHQAFASALAAEGRQVFFVEDMGLGTLCFGRLARRGPPGGTPPPAGLAVVSPVVLPPTCGLFRALNAAFLVPALVARLRRLGLDSGPAVICWLPTDTTLRVVDRLAPDRVVYDCVDDFYARPDRPGDLAESEAALLERADVVFNATPPLFDRNASRHPNVHLLQDDQAESSTEAQAVRAAGLIESAPRRPPAAPWEGTSWPTTPVSWGLCAFALALPFSLGGANVGWALAAAARLRSTACGTGPWQTSARMR